MAEYGMVSPFRDGNLVLRTWRQPPGLFRPVKLSRQILRRGHTSVHSNPIDKPSLGVYFAM